MGLLRKHNSCRGLLLWKWGRTQAELWYCPRGEVIDSHTHEEFDGLIVYLFGGMIVWTEAKGCRVIGWRDWLKTLRIPAGLKHGAIGDWPRGCLFLNIETWKHDRPTSAAVDFRVS